MTGHIRSVVSAADDLASLVHRLIRSIGQSDSPTASKHLPLERVRGLGFTAKEQTGPTPQVGPTRLRPSVSQSAGVVEILSEKRLSPTS